MRISIAALVSAAALSAAAAAPLRADAPDRLFIRPWIEREPLVRIGPGPYPIPLDAAEKSLLELGRQLISGLIENLDVMAVEEATATTDLGELLVRRQDGR